MGLWFWSGSADELVADAKSILLHFVHPLIARRLPYCLGFPFGADVFAPAQLGVGDMARLDVEDIGALLGVTPARPASLGRLVAHSVAPRREHLDDATAGAGCAAVEAGAGFDAAQLAAVRHHCGPARVLAPAGSGKTKTLVGRVAELVARGTDPGAILLLAFNRKAAEQLEERLAALNIPTTRRLDGAASATRRGAVHCATFNAFGYRYLRDVAEARPRLDADGSAQRRTMRQALERAGWSLASLQPARGSDPVGACLSALTRVRAGLEPPTNIVVHVESAGDQALVPLPFDPIHACFCRLQSASGEQSFDDQVYLTVVDLLANPARRSSLQRRFTHVLVDEFQDLNGAQLALVDLLSRPRRELFVVGDDDQLIYGWRFADATGILGFHQRMPPKPLSATYALRTNYRCSRAVVEAAARLIAHNAVREPKDVRPRDGAHDGTVSFAGAATWPERAATITGFLRAEKSRLGCAWRDLAVLSRYRSQQLVVALALDADGIPRSPTLGYRLFTHPVARLLRAYLDLVLDPPCVSGEALRRLLNQPNRFLGEATVGAIAGAPRPWAQLLASAAREQPGGPQHLTTLRAQVERLGAAFAAEPTLDAACLLGTVIEQFSLEALWCRTVVDDGDVERDSPWQVVDALAMFAETYPKPAIFLATWDRLGADEAAHSDMSDDSLAREQAEEDRVVLGTIHAAKGREYHSVAIPDYDPDTTHWDAAHVEEERRVLYVGVTRARDAALLTVDTSRAWVQPFLRELVPLPTASEHAELSALLSEARDDERRRRLKARLREIEILFPELLPP